jgi:ABC-2 type transport system ATP-binding protein
MEQGRLVTSGRVDDILQRLQSSLHLEIEVAHGLEKLEALLKADAGATNLRLSTNRLVCDWSTGREALPDLHRRIVAAEIGLVALAVRTDNLEDLYMKLSGHQTS